MRYYEESTEGGGGGQVSYMCRLFSSQQPSRFQLLEEKGQRRGTIPCQRGSVTSPIRNKSQGQKSLPSRYQPLARVILQSCPSLYPEHFKSRYSFHMPHACEQNGTHGAFNMFTNKHVQFSNLFSFIQLNYPGQYE